MLIVIFPIFMQFLNALNMLLKLVTLVLDHGVFHNHKMTLTRFQSPLPHFSLPFLENYLVHFVYAVRVTCGVV